MNIKLAPVLDIQTTILTIGNIIVNNYMFDKDPNAEKLMGEDMQTVLATLWPGFIVHVNPLLNNVSASFEIELQLSYLETIETVYSKITTFEIGNLNDY